jgi:N-acetylglutamate synthase-like GNAT family acetyltransferase
MISTEGEIRLVDFEPRHREHFVALNLEWISHHFEVEEADRQIFDDPGAAIIAPGGQIVMAENEDGVLGTCALIRVDQDSFELAKMAVRPSARGWGIGHRLGVEVIERARRAGAKRVELVTNSKLVSALALYRRLGFREVPLESAEYRRADVKMVLDLENAAAGEARRSI